LAARWMGRSHLDRTHCRRRNRGAGCHRLRAWQRDRDRCSYPARRYFPACSSSRRRPPGTAPRSSRWCCKYRPKDNKIHFGNSWGSQQGSHQGDSPRTSTSHGRSRGSRVDRRWSHKLPLLGASDAVVVPTAGTSLPVGAVSCTALDRTAGHLGRDSVGYKVWHIARRRDCRGSCTPFPSGTA